MHNIKNLNLKKIDLIILFTMTILVCVGLFCVRQAYKQSDGLNAILIKQIVGIIIGYLLIFVVIVVDYHIICNLSWPLYIGTILILAYTLLFGSNINGVKRWFMIFGIPIQPSEITKVVLIVFIAYLCGCFKDKLDKLYVLLILTILVALPTILILLEPHLSSSLSLLFIFCILVYSSGLSYKLIGKVLAVIIPIILIIFIGITQFNLSLPFVEQYQIERIESYFSNDDSENTDGAYQQNQSLTAIASGGLTGKLITENPSERNYSNIYAKESDFVFSIVGEEFGFIGSFVIIFLYSILIFRCLIISTHISDYTGKLICIGVSTLIMFQFFVNVGVATRLLPNTGLPLPFISNGLTSLISSMIAIGLVLNIDLRQKSKKQI